MPDEIDEAVADLAAVFHWPLRDIDPMSVEDLALWWAKARARANPTDQEGSFDG